MKPREWWINIFSKVVLKKEPELALRMDDDIVHVIEHCEYDEVKSQLRVEKEAYDALNAQLERLKITLKQFDLEVASVRKAELRLRAGLEKAAEVIHDEFCSGVYRDGVRIGDSHHAFCVEARAALRAQE